MGDSRKIRTILFNILVILTLVFIYIFFFPKKSYVKSKVENGLNDIVESTFNQNMESMRISGTEYFTSRENGTVTLQQLIDEGLSAELKDSKGETCSTASYIEKDDKKMKIHLDCTDKKGDKILNLSDNKFICIYQYEKKTEEGYTDWSEWSEWQKEPVEKDELTNVETETRQELDGKRKEQKSRQESIAATSKQACPNGTTELGNKCKFRKYVGDVNLFYGECPNNDTRYEYDPNGSNCKKYEIYYTDKNNTASSCPQGYNLSGNRCYKTVYYEEEVDNYKDVTYYRYKTRKKTNAKTDIKCSIKDDQELLNQSYTMVGKTTCEF